MAEPATGTFATPVEIATTLTPAQVDAAAKAAPIVDANMKLLNGGLQLGNAVSGFVNQILNWGGQFYAAQKTFEVQMEALSLAGKKEDHQFALNSRMLDIQQEMSKDVLKFKKEELETMADVTVRTKEIDATVQIAAIRANALAESFGRGRYGYGRPAYA